ncbi:Sec-independent protein translocase subunit TatB [Luteococcus sp. Sow4_B9]|uniref:Sec-independent protein translocase subunit TatB n=1 Tax=Luteococcus sp. Sow4_B9 TaxID=3438792 RepID=UPI003F98AAAA
MFGPEKVPELSRKAARVIHFLRNIANNAQDQLRAELGPQYADLELRDLNPKNFVQKHLLDELQADIDDIKSDLSEVRTDLDGSVRDARMLGEDVRHEFESASHYDEVASGAVPVPWDVDAT